MHIGIMAYGGLFICYLLARLAVGERWNVVALANNLLPWLCWTGMILGGIGLLYADRWLLAGLQMPALVVFGVVYGTLFLPGRATPAADEPTLTVATYNVCG
jgi:hypothetical protein